MVVTMHADNRWKQRFQHFERSLRVLEEVASIESPSLGEKMGTIQAFEICFELAWKTLADFFKEQGYQLAGPKDVLKQAFTDGIVTQGHMWMQALESRNFTVHAYDEATTNTIADNIRASYLPILKELLNVLYEKYK